MTKTVNQTLLTFLFLVCKISMLFFLFYYQLVFNIHIFTDVQLFVTLICFFFFIRLSFLYLDVATLLTIIRMYPCSLNNTQKPYTHYFQFFGCYHGYFLIFSLSYVECFDFDDIFLRIFTLVTSE